MLFTVLKLLNQRPYIVVRSRGDVLLIHNSPFVPDILNLALSPHLDAFSALLETFYNSNLLILGLFAPLHCVQTRCNRIKRQALNSTSVLIQSFYQVLLQHVLVRFGFCCVLRPLVLADSKKNSTIKVKSILRICNFLPLCRERICVWFRLFLSYVENRKSSQSGL